MLTSTQKKFFVATSIVILIFAGFIAVLLPYVIDEKPPRIVSISFNQTPIVNTSITIQVNAVDDSRIVSAEINYRIKEGSWISDEMKKYFIICCPPRFIIRMGPFQEVGIQVEFYFRIKDSHNNELITDTYSIEIVSA